MKIHLFIAALLIPTAAMAADWRPVTSAELAQKTPRVDPAADAEAIFWDVKIEDRVQGVDVALAMNHYIRIKIFTGRGKEKFATVELEQAGKRSISEIAGRTIKPDGTILELKKDAIFDRELDRQFGAGEATLSEGARGHLEECVRCRRLNGWAGSALKQPNQQENSMGA